MPFLALAEHEKTCAGIDVLLQPLGLLLSCPAQPHALKVMRKALRWATGPDHSHPVASSWLAALPGEDAFGLPGLGEQFPHALPLVLVEQHVRSRRYPFKLLKGQMVGTRKERVHDGIQLSLGKKLREGLQLLAIRRAEPRTDQS